MKILTDKKLKQMLKESNQRGYSSGVKGCHELVRNAVINAGGTCYEEPISVTGDLTLSGNGTFFGKVSCSHLVIGKDMVLFSDLAVGGY